MNGELARHRRTQENTEMFVTGGQMRHKKKENWEKQF